jgi:hypothetical protein
MFGRWRKSPENIYRRMGYFSDQKGIWNRYNREKKFWDEHIRKTHQTILGFCAKTGKNKIAILGSGWLLDVPLAELKELFQEIYLIDIRHPETLIRQYQSERVKFITMDISGFVMPVYQMSRQNSVITKGLVDGLKPDFSMTFETFDCIISCNILDQLDDLIIDYLQKNNIISTESEQRLRTRIQNEHIHQLPSGKSLVITDISEAVINENDEVITSRNVLLCRTNALERVCEWDWKFDNLGRYHDQGNTRFHVGAFVKK